MFAFFRHVLIIFSLGLLPMISSGAVLVQQNASYFAFEAENYDTLTPNTGTSAWTVITTTTGPKLLPSDTAAVGGAALYSQGSDSNYATYRLQFTSNGTYYFYSRFSFFDRNGDSSYGNEDSYYIADAFNQSAVAGGVWHEQHTGGSFPNEGKTFFWDEGNKMKTDGANRVPDGVHTYTITGASEASPVEVTFTIRGREPGMTLDRFIFSKTQYNPSTQNAILDGFASVPEPSRALLIAMALTMTIMRRKRLS